MSNSKSTREAKQRMELAERDTKIAQQQSEIARNEAAKQASEQVKITPEADRVLKDSGKAYNALREGRLTDVPLITNFLSNRAAAAETADRASPTGMDNLAFGIANPNLIAMNRMRLQDERARESASGVSALAADAEDQAVSRIGAVSGMDLGARTSLVNFLFSNAGLAQSNVGLAQNTQNTAFQRYIKEKEHRTFGQQLIGGALAGGASILSSYFGKPS